MAKAMLTTVLEIGDRVIKELGQEDTLCLYSALNFNQGCRGKLTVINYIVNILRKIPLPFQATCAGGVVEWLCGDIPTFDNIDIFIFSDAMIWETQLFLLEIFPTFKCHEKKYPECQKDIVFLGCIRVPMLLCYRNEINVQFRGHRYLSPHSLVKNFDLPNACGSAITLSNDTIFLSQFFGKTNLSIPVDKPCMIVRTGNVNHAQKPVTFFRFRKYCLKIGCFCLIKYPRGAPTAIIKQCRLFTHKRPKKGLDDLFLSTYPLSTDLVLNKQFTYQAFCDYLCQSNKMTI